MSRRVDGVVDAAGALVAPEIVHSLAFQCLARGRLSYEGVSPDLLVWKRAYERALWNAGLPFFFDELGESSARLVHYPAGVDLVRPAWMVVGSLGLEVARQVEVAMAWGGSGRPFRPSLWELGGARG